MWHLTAMLAILITSSAMITTSEETEDSVHCLTAWTPCGLLSKSCCQRRNSRNRSSEVVEKHCDYLQRRICLEVDEIHRYRDVLLIEKLKDDDDFRMIYDKYVEYLTKIEEHLDLKRFMERMYESTIPARKSG